MTASINATRVIMRVICLCHSPLLKTHLSKREQTLKRRLPSSPHLSMTAQWRSVELAAPKHTRSILDRRAARVLRLRCPFKFEWFVFTRMQNSVFLIHAANAITRARCYSAETTYKAKDSNKGTSTTKQQTTKQKQTKQTKSTLHNPSSAQTKTIN